MARPKFRILAGLVTGLLFLSGSSYAADIVVNSSGQIVDGDVSSIDALNLDPGHNNLISINEAIIAANNTPGSDRITFRPNQVVEVRDTLPTLSDNTGGTIIEGAGNARLELIGYFGLRIESAGNEIRGLIIQGTQYNFGAGILISGENAQNNRVLGCTIVDLGQYGIIIDQGASNNEIGGVMSGEGNEIRSIRTSFAIIPGVPPPPPIAYGKGILIDAANDNIILGNSLVSLPVAVELRNGARANQIGGELPGSRNTFYSLNYGVRILGASENRVQGNSFRDAGVAGVELSSFDGTAASGNLIGGINEGLKNELINTGSLAFLEELDVVRFAGIVVDDAVNEVIAGNCLRANWQNGIVVTANASQITIGGETSVSGNTITDSRRTGIVIDSTTGVTVRNNSITDNDDEGILITAYPGLLAFTPRIHSLNPVAGITFPGATVELFLDPEEEAETLVDTLIADDSGTFSSDINVADYPAMNLTAIATDATTGNSSAIGVYYHDADTNLDRRISLSELMRVIQLYNSNEYACDPVSEDGFVADAGNRSCEPHNADFEEPLWSIRLSELLRMIQYYQAVSCIDDPPPVYDRPCMIEARTGIYYPCRDQGTDDGFCPGVR